jgi:HEAT repeat protein
VVREAAAETLGRIGDARAVEPLITALNDEIEDMRRTAAEGLAAIYRLGKLDDAQRATLLAQREAIASQHHDYSTGCGDHADEIIRIAFPD